MGLAEVSPKGPFHLLFQLPVGGRVGGQDVVHLDGLLLQIGQEFSGNHLALHPSVEDLVDPPVDQVEGEVDEETEPALQLLRLVAVVHLHGGVGPALELEVVEELGDRGHGVQGHLAARADGDGWEDQLLHGPGHGLDGGEVRPRVPLGGGHAEHQHRHDGSRCNHQKLWGRHICC